MLIYHSSTYLGPILDLLGVIVDRFLPFPKDVFALQAQGGGTSIVVKLIVAPPDNVHIWPWKFGVTE